VIAFTSLESAAGVAGEVRISRRALKRVVGSGTAVVVLLYAGIALVAVTALPVHGGHTDLATRYMNAPMLGVVARTHPHWLEQTLRYLVGGLGALTLVAAANSAMLGPLAAGLLAVDQTVRSRAGSAGCTPGARPPTC